MMLKFLRADSPSIDMDDSPLDELDITTDINSDDDCIPIGRKRAACGGHPDSR